jgi:hypothetical protein
MRTQYSFFWPFGSYWFDAAGLVPNRSVSAQRDALDAAIQELVNLGSQRYRAFDFPNIHGDGQRTSSNSASSFEPC